VRTAEKTDAILVLNPDLVLGENAARLMLDALRQPGTGIVSPRVLNADGSLEQSLRREPSIPRALGLSRTGIALFAECLTRPTEYVEPRVVDWALGAALLISRACFDAVSGWDESYFLYSEETEFCLRARDLGFLTRYEPGAVVTHLAGGSGRNNRTHTMLTVNRVRLYRRRHGAIASWAYFSLTVLREVSRIHRDDGRHRAAVIALLQPSRRPAELACSDRLVPGW
jgi:GT2 family glycosyltransferase